MDGIGEEFPLRINMRIGRNTESQKARAQSREFIQQGLPPCRIIERRVTGIMQRVIGRWVGVMTAHPEKAEPVEADAGAKLPLGFRPGEILFHDVSVKGKGEALWFFTEEKQFQFFDVLVGVNATE
ncbi:MAG: hypothetical protein B9S32_14905 [Verrucomicrobia bacterium Tous-C9LFEB]|nr:MAG: hypothetical protein B9S32_14905 [Verrucomicrobia bacterium Tous-C9LFEB]